MRGNLQELCEQFIQNREILKNRFRMESSYIYPICSNIFCSRGIIADEETLVDCKALLKERVGAFSNFRGNLSLPIISMLASGPNPAGRLDQAVENYVLLKKRFWSSQYLALAAFLLAEMGLGARAEDCADRAKTIYDRIKKEHPLLTSAEDCVYSILMSLSDKTDDALIDDIEQCYHIIKCHFSSSNAAQSAAHVLSFSHEDSISKADRLFAIYQSMLAEGMKFGKHEQLATLAAVSTLHFDEKQIVQDIIDVAQWLSAQKGYGIFGLDRKTRLMHAAMLVLDGCCADDTKCHDVFVGNFSNAAAQTAAQSAVVTSTLAMLAAQQAVLCAATSASAAASAAH